jgi:methionyl-tRNA formyltransferase
MPLRVVFMGTPQFSVPVLERIVADGHNVVCVYTRAPKRAGRRGLSVTKSPVHTVTESLGLPVRHPVTVRSDDEGDAMRSFCADVAIVVAYGLILPRQILEAPVHGCLNLHASLLPRWRGAAPIQRALIAGDAETGVMLMRMEEGLDTGPVALTSRTQIEPDLTAGELHDRLSLASAELASEGLRLLAEKKLVFVPQTEEGVAYAHKIEKSEARIDWSMGAESLHNLIRGLSPFPGAWCEMDLGAGPERVKILRTTRLDVSDVGAPGTILDERLTVAAGDGALRILELQRSGKIPMRTEDFIRGLTRLPVAVS